MYRLTLRLMAIPACLLGAVFVAAFVVKSAGAAALVLVGGAATLYALRDKQDAPRPLAMPEIEDCSGDESGAPGLCSGLTAALRGIMRTMTPGLRLPFLLGEVGGVPRWLDMTKAPHILVGGSTGSGKSTFLHTMIATMTTAVPSSALRLVLIDPKRVELSRYRNTLAHLSDYASEGPRAYAVLRGIEAEMERRYAGMEHHGITDISQSAEARVLVVIDEYADLILTTRKTCFDVEPILYRLLALGRAAGIHVVLATQRPDAKVVTGLVKANAPTRIAFRTSNAVESRIILDAKGAETLPGGGAGMIVCGQAPNLEEPGRPLRFQGVRLPDLR